MKAEVQRFKQPIEAIEESPADVKVFLAGGADADAYIFGHTESPGGPG